MYKLNASSSLETLHFGADHYQTPFEVQLLLHLLIISFLSPQASAYLVEVCPLTSALVVEFFVMFMSFPTNSRGSPEDEMKPRP